MKHNKSGVMIVEAVFDAAYLASAFALSVLLSRRGESQRIFGTAGFVLFSGDAFHLVPRMLGMGNAAKGLGKLWL